MEKTLAFIKPEAVCDNNSGKIINDIEVNHSVLNGGMSEFLESIINYYE